MCDTGHAIARALECEVWVARFEGELSMDASCMRGGMLGGAWQGAGGGAVRGAGEDAPPSSRVRRTARVA